jgi:hypothetical protein
VHAPPGSTAPAVLAHGLLLGTGIGLILAMKLMWRCDITMVELPTAGDSSTALSAGWPQYTAQLQLATGGPYIPALKHAATAAELTASISTAADAACQGKSRLTEVQQRLPELPWSARILVSDSSRCRSMACCLPVCQVVGYHVGSMPVACRHAALCMVAKLCKSTTRSQQLTLLQLPASSPPTPQITCFNNIVAMYMHTVH